MELASLQNSFSTTEYGTCWGGGGGHNRWGVGRSHGPINCLHLLQVADWSSAVWTCWPSDQRSPVCKGCLLAQSQTNRACQHTPATVNGMSPQQCEQKNTYIHTHTHCSPHHHHNTSQSPQYCRSSQLVHLRRVLQMYYKFLNLAVH